MNPAQLLNPKAFAKEQAKAKANKRPQSLGPQQTRKPAAAAVQPRQTYDAKALLNPKSANGGRPALKKDDSVEEADSYNAAKMIERHNNLRERQDALVPKRKVELVEDDTDDDRKKQKTASGFGSGGVLSEHLKEEQKRLNSDPKTTIDLTNDDDDVVQQGDVQLLDTSNQEVLLGVFTGSANMFRIPTAPRNTAIGKDHWPRTKVTFRRELNNNTTIDLYDIARQHFGTLDNKSATALCPLIQGGPVNKMRLKMYLHPRSKKPDEHVGQRVSLNAKLDILVFAPRDKATPVAKFLSQRQIFLRKPAGDTGAEFVDAQVPQNFGPSQLKPQTRITSVQRSTEEMRRETSTMFDNLTKLQDLPQMEADTAIIRRPLLSHQKQALHFLMEHERNDFTGTDSAPYSLWKYKPHDNGKPAWYHLITSEEVLEKPESIQGGILADVMGLGKTLSILTLIAETRGAAKRFRSQEPPASDTLERNARGTLIICPKSVLSNWDEQIREHTAPGTIKVYQYHGSTRTQDLDELSKYDIVLTTYNTAAAELGRTRMRALAALNWFRIVLDEAHSIRTHTTQISKACCALNAERRWAVTGTPIQNNLNDMGALVKFLRLKPFDSPMTWAQFIMSPFKSGDVNVIEHLQLLVSSITLRRTKGALEIQLPNRDEQRERLLFSDHEATLYKQFAKKSRSQFDRITQGGSAVRGKAYAHILKSITRLRAICAHGREMLTEDDMREIEGDDPSNAIILDIGDEPGREGTEEPISDKLAYETFHMMADSDAATCSNCSNKLLKADEAEEVEGEHSSDEETDDSGSDREQPVIGYLTPCYHLICRKCVEQHEKEVKAKLTSDHHYECQYCEAYVRNWLFTLQQKGYKRYKDGREAKKSNAARWDENTYSGAHTKVKALLEDLRKSAEETKALSPGEPPVRSVVFSGWTSYLDLIEYALTKHEIGFTRIDGAMSVKRRSQALHLFNTLDSVTVLLVSIKAGGQGLNFTAANKVYVMEPQFNPGVEQQAVDRVHRIGQTRPVTIKHYIMKESIEEKILLLQKKKEDLARLSMERKRSRAEDSKQRMDQLKELFK